MANLLDRMTAEDREKYSHLIMPVNTNIGIDSVILSSDNKEKLRQFLEEYKFKDQLVKYGLKPVNRLLFYGASGTGKTYLTKALSNYMGKDMIYVDIAQSLSDDTVAKNISDIFYVAHKYKNCIVFFDECDSVAWSRDSKNSDGGTIRRATNSIFQQLDQMDYDTVFVACTNMLKRLDPAFERRFDMKFEFRRPDMTLREVFKKFLFKDFRLIEDVNMEDELIIKKRSTLSYYEYQIITERNMKKAVINGTTDVKLSDILQDVAIQIGSKRDFGTNKDDSQTFESPVKNDDVTYTSSIT